jgi:endoglycosylceramidase
MRRFIWLNLLAALLCAAAARAASPPAPSIDAPFIVLAEDHQITGNRGRRRLFRGINVVYKPAPFYPPITDRFDPLLSLCDEDLDNLAEWGFNIIRFYVAWAGVEPELGAYNKTYLHTLTALVARMRSRGIYVILDAHQDALAREWCGEGLPSWATANATLPVHAFPAPLKNATLQRDKATGLPTIASCTERPFADYYGTYAVAQTFQRLYDNTGGLRDSFVEFWRVVATAFRGADNVLGFDLINEPWMGDQFSNPRLLTPGVADRTNIQPLYNAVAAGIRSVDATKLLFYEPVVWDFFESGFTEVPGGEAHRNTSVLSYHVYCPTFNPKLGAAGRALCRVADSAFFNAREKDVARLGGASFLTEFGSLGETDADLNEINRVLDLADAHVQSTVYWAFKAYNDYTSTGGASMSLYDASGRLQKKKLRALARSYPQAVCGTIVSTTFDSTSASYKLVYVFSAAAWTDGDSDYACTTEIYVNEAMHYSRGVHIDVSVSGGDDGGVSHTTAHNRVYVHHMRHRVVVKDSSKSMKVSIRVTERGA